MGHIPGYKGNEVEMKGDVFDRFYKIYNDTGGVLTNGDVVTINFGADNDSTGYYPLVATPATTSIPVVVGVVENSALGLGTIADQAWGFVQTRGYCPAITKTTTSNPVAINDLLKAMNSVKTAATDGTSGSTAWATTSFAIAKSVVATGVAGTVTGILFGREVTI